MARADKRPPEDPSGQPAGTPRDRSEAVQRQKAMQKQLRDMFDQVAHEPLSDELTRLLNELGNSDDQT